MSEDAGAEVNRGVFLFGGRFLYKGLDIGAINYYSDDIINIFYTEGSYKLNVTERLGLLFQPNLQSSVVWARIFSRGILSTRTSLE